MARRELWDQVDADLYLILAVPRTATVDEIQVAWRDVAKRTHPDRGGSVGEFQQAEVAYQVLSDPLERSRYDRFTAGAAAHTSSGAQSAYSTPGAGWRPAGTNASGPYGPVFDTEVPHPADLPPHTPWNPWLVVMFIVAIVIGIAVLLLFAVAAIILLIAGAAAGLGTLLLGRSSGRKG